MFVINPQDRTPIFSQLKKQIIEFIGIGILKENDQLPSVRSLAADLGINPNTVSKAYQELELQGYLYTITGKGCFIAKTIKSEDIKNNKLEEFRRLSKECYRYKIDKNTLINILNEEEVNEC